MPKRKVVNYFVLLRKYRKSAELLCVLFCQRDVYAAFGFNRIGYGQLKGIAFKAQIFKRCFSYGDCGILYCFFNVLFCFAAQKVFGHLYVKVAC